jgi:ATP-dependent Lhr-like helicase
VSDATMKVAWVSGGTHRHHRGGLHRAAVARATCFVFAGRLLEFVRTQDLTAYVRKASKPKGRGAGLGRQQDAAVQRAGRRRAGSAGPRGRGPFADRGPRAKDDLPRARAAGRAADAAGAGPAVAHPAAHRLLVERYTSREGTTCSCTPLPGATCTSAWRSCWPGGSGRATQPNTFSLSVNDLGLEIVGARRSTWSAADAKRAVQHARPAADVLASLNSGELAQRRFREIARVAGLVFGGYPGAPKSMRQLQASSAVLRGLPQVRCRQPPAGAGRRRGAGAGAGPAAPEDHAAAPGPTAMDLVDLRAPSPFCLPLMVERLREQLSTEKLEDRLARLLADAEAALLDGPLRRGPRRRP